MFGYGDNDPRKKWLLNPRSPFCSNWDICTALLLLFVAIVTPFEVGFLETDLDSRLLWLFIFNRITDIWFFMDLVFNFFLPYRVSSHGIASLPLGVSWMKLEIEECLTRGFVYHRMKMVMKFTLVS